MFRAAWICLVLLLLGYFSIIPNAHAQGGLAPMTFLKASPRVRRILSNLTRAKNSASVLSSILQLIPKKHVLNSSYVKHKSDGGYDFNFTDPEVNKLLYDSSNGSKLIAVKEVLIPGGNIPVPLQHPNNRLNQKPVKHIKISAVNNNGSADVPAKSSQDFLRMLMGLGQTGKGGKGSLFNNFPVRMEETVIDGRPSSTSWSNPATTYKTKNQQTNEIEYSRETLSQILRKAPSENEGESLVLNYNSNTNDFQKVEDDRYDKTHGNEEILHQKETSNFEPSNAALQDDDPEKYIKDGFMQDITSNSTKDTADHPDSKTKIKFYKTGKHVIDNPRLPEEIEDGEGRSQLDLYHVKNRPFYITSNERPEHNDNTKPVDADNKDKSPGEEPGANKARNQAQYGHDGFMMPHEAFFPHQEGSVSSPGFYPGPIPDPNNNNYNNIQFMRPEDAPPGPYPHFGEFNQQNGLHPVWHHPSQIYQGNQEPGSEIEGQPTSDSSEETSSHSNDEDYNVAHSTPMPDNPTPTVDMQEAVSKHEPERSSQTQQNLATDYFDRLPPDAMYPPSSDHALPPYEDNGRIFTHSQTHSDPNLPPFSAAYPHGPPYPPQLNMARYEHDSNQFNPSYAQQFIIDTQSQNNGTSYNYNPGIPMYSPVQPPSTEQSHVSSISSYPTSNIVNNSPSNSPLPGMSPSSFMNEVSSSSVSNAASAQINQYPTLKNNVRKLSSQPSTQDALQTKITHANYVSQPDQQPQVDRQQSIFNEIKQETGGRYSPFLVHSGYAQSNPTHLQIGPEEYLIPPPELAEAAVVAAANQGSPPPGLVESIRENVPGSPAEPSPPDSFQEGQSQMIPFDNGVPQESLYETGSSSDAPNRAAPDTESYMSRQEEPHSGPQPAGPESWMQQGEYVGADASSPLIPPNQFEGSAPESVMAQASSELAKSNMNSENFNRMAGQSSWVQSSNNLGTQFSGYPKLQAPVSKSYQSSTIIGVNVKCNLNRNEMKIEVQFKDKFYGVIYTKGYYKVDQCRTKGHGANTVYLILPLDGCGNSIVTQGSDLSNGITSFVSHINILNNMVMGVITAQDVAYRATCILGGNGGTALESGIQVPMSLPHGVQSAMTMPPAWMTIVEGKDPHAAPARDMKLGQVGTVVIKVHDTQGLFDVYPYNCFAHDGMGTGRLQLLDQNGCPIHTQIVGPQSRDVSQGLLVFFHFKVFKFPDVNNVYFVCEIKICYKKCQQPSCGLFTPSKHRRRRRDIKKLFSPDVYAHEIDDAKSLKYNHTIHFLQIKSTNNNSKIDTPLGKNLIGHPHISQARQPGKDLIKTSTIFQSIVVKIPAEEEEEYQELHGSPRNGSALDPKWTDKNLSYESEEEYLYESEYMNTYKYYGGHKRQQQGGISPKYRKINPKEICISRITFATTLGLLFTLIVVIATVSFYHLTKNQIRKLSTKLSSFDNAEYFGSPYLAEKDNKHILGNASAYGNSGGSWRSNRSNQSLKSTDTTVVNNPKNSFPLRLHPFCYK